MGSSRFGERLFGRLLGHHAGRYAASISGSIFIGLSRAKRLRFLGGGGEEKFVAGAVWTPEAQAGQSKDALEMGEQHLDLLPRRQASWYCGVAGKGTGHVAGVFVQIPWDLAGDIVGTALRFEFAGVAIQFAGAIESCALGCDAASGNGVGASELDQFLAGRAGVTVALGVEFEIDWGECAIGSV
jgi:hypothetical protein